MFSIKEKQHISQVIEDTIRTLNHPEMDNENIKFLLHVDGKKSWSWADIHETSIASPLHQNSWNEIASDIMPK